MLHQPGAFLFEGFNGESKCFLGNLCRTLVTLISVLRKQPKARSLRAWVPISTLQPPLRCGKLAPTLRWLHRRTSNLRERGGGSSWCMHSASIDSAASVSANPSDGLLLFFLWCRSRKFLKTSQPLSAVSSLLLLANSEVVDSLAYSRTLSSLR